MDQQNDKKKQKDPNESVLIEAIKSKCSPQTVLSILSREGNVDFRDKKGLTALAYAIKQGRKEIVEALISRGADVNAKGEKGDFLLIRAIKKGKAGIVKPLLQSGADINARDKNGNTALMYAVCVDLSITKILVQAGANINDKNNKGMTALMKISGFNSLWAIKETWGFDPDIPSSDVTKVIKYLIEMGVEIEEKDNNGETALMYAAKSGKIESIENLKKTSGPISNKISVQQIGSIQAIMRAANRKETFVRANINAVNNQGYSALMLAIEHREYDTFIYLLKHGAFVNIESENGKTALSLAKSLWVFKNSYVKALLEAGARN